MTLFILFGVYSVSCGPSVEVSTPTALPAVYEPTPTVPPPTPTPIPFDGGRIDANSISKAVQKALEASGKELPKGVQDQLKEALKGLPGAMSIQVGTPQPVMGKDATAQKLDEILERLDKLEKQVRDLKKNER